MAATHLYLIRHADNADGLEDGLYRDLGLSPQGIAQAERLRDRLLQSNEIRADVFISSPERRAHQTARILLPVFGQPILDSDVEEWRSDDGRLTPDEFMERWCNVPKSQKAYYRWYEGGENRAEFMLRAQLALNRIAQSYMGKTIVVLSHGAFIQVSFSYFFGYGEASIDRAIPEIRHTSITHWYQAEDQERWTLERSNDHHHLSK